MNADQIVPLEHFEQVNFIEWVDLLIHLETHEALDYLFAVPNGGKRNLITGALLKAEGVRKGVPDIFLLYPSQGYAGLVIEMKRINGKPSDVSKEQRTWLGRLERSGFKTVVANGGLEARQAVCEYLQIKDPIE